MRWNQSLRLEGTKSAVISEGLHCYGFDIPP